MGHSHNVRFMGTIAALVATVGAMFALAADPLSSPKPEPVAVPVPDEGGTLVVDLVDGASESDLQQIEALLGADLDWTHPQHSVDEALAEGWSSDLDDAVAILRGHPLVEVAEPALEMTTQGFPNDPLFEKQWHMREMGAPDGWANSPMGRGVIVAVVDTGVAKVEDLEGTQILKGASFVPGTPTATDDQGHGTHVAGTIAQTTNNGIGVAGVAPKATILPVKVLSGSGSGSSSWIAAGIDYAVDNGAQVINLSLGGPYSLVIHNSIRKAQKKGVVVVAAAGNSGRRGVGYPGALTEAIGVSALGPGGKMAPYSSYGKGVDIAAPGGDKTQTGGGVLQDTIDGKGGHHYVEFQGTSMATPHVAGAAAVLISQGVPPAKVRDTLLKSAQGAGEWDEKFGWGRLDLKRALGSTSDRDGGTRFAIGVLFALLVAHLAGASSSFRNASAGVGGVVAGGLFFLHWLPLPDLVVVQLLGNSFLSWPAILVGPDWAHFPLWLSALVPGLVAFTLGAARPTRSLALGLTCGVGAHLFHGAATGSLEPWWLPQSLGVAWLGLNGTLCLLFGLALAGAHKLETKGKG